MVWDILLPILAAICQTVTCILGWRVTVDGVRPERKKLYEWLFGLSCLLGIVCIGIISYRSGSIADAISKILKRQETSEQKLNKIEQQTAQPPKLDINIPQAVPKPRASMSVAYTSEADGIQFGIDPKRPEMGWLANAYCKNIGTVIAKNVSCEESIKILDAVHGFPNKKDEMEFWKTTVRSKDPSPPVDLLPGNFRWGTVSLHMQEIDPKLISGDKVIIVGGRIFYSDEAGPHEAEFCKWVQPPFEPHNIIWHFCEIGHNKEAY